MFILNIEKNNRYLVVILKFIFNILFLSRMKIYIKYTSTLGHLPLTHK